MKHIVCFLILLLLTSCAQNINKQVAEPPPPQTVTPSSAKINIPIQKSEKHVLKHETLNREIQATFGRLLSNVSISTASFNPSKGDKVTIRYSLSKTARVKVRVYDPDSGLVLILLNSKEQSAGKHAIIWDGKDMDGNIVPDEAYFFTIVAEGPGKQKEIYDPITFSGGEEHDITKADINREAGTIVYRMPEAGRVMIRIGIQGGALLNTLVDWKPRVKGIITEYWNGKDKDNLIYLYGYPKLKIIISYFTLPENSIISFGNNSVTYRKYKETSAKNRAVKQKRLSSVKEVSPHYLLPRTLDYSPDLNVTFSNIKGVTNQGVPILSKKTLVKVELAENDRLNFENQQFEICFFLDNEFYAEDETGYTPFNWVWDLSDVHPGEHILTVNLSGFKDQIGVKSRKIKIVR